MGRVFIFGAGFSKPAKMPLATEILPLLVKKLHNNETKEWLKGLVERLKWFEGDVADPNPFSANIEQVFHYGHFNIENCRLRQHMCTVGRIHGETPWSQGESIRSWLSQLEHHLRDVISEHDEKSDLVPIVRWARAIKDDDTVLTFNYDTLAERALDTAGMPWNHCFEKEIKAGVPVFKLHGSIDWIIAHRSESFSKSNLLFDKRNENAGNTRANGYTGDFEDDYRLWRCTSLDQRRKWIEGRDVQYVHKDAMPSTVGIAGLGAYKELYRVPGLGLVWARGRQALLKADRVIVVGFALSDFDGMAQMQFAGVAMARHRENRPLPVVVINPRLDEAGMSRFRRVFRSVEFVREFHEKIDWSKFN